MTASTREIISFLMINFILTLSFSAKAQDLKDFDCNLYKTITHGKQVWAAANLNVSHFRNGDIIPEARTEEEWTNAGKSGNPAWCCFNNDPENGRKFGKLYNWYAVNDPRGLAPEGWRIPTTNDWTALVKNLFGVDIAGTKLKSPYGWKNKKGTNNIGFTALPAGIRDQDGKFKDIGKTCQWWSNSVPVEVKPSGMIYSIMLNDNTPEVRYKKSGKSNGFSVRFIKD